MLKLNNKGISHVVLPLLVIVVVAIGGVYMLVSSHANGFGNYGSNKNSSNSSSSGFGNTSGSKKAKKPAGFGKFPDAGGKVSKDKPSGADSGNGGGGSGGDTGGDGGQAVTTGAGSGTVTITNPPTSKASSLNPSKASGDIIVVTYVDDPAIDKKGDKDHRIGGVKVKIEKTNGKNNCDNRKTTVVKTNRTKNGKSKSGKPVLIHGTAHFLSCDTGTYKATLIGRSGYEAVSPKVRTFTLKDNETEVPYFVVKKKVKSTNTSKQTTTPSQANGDGTGNGGAAAPTQ